MLLSVLHIVMARRPNLDSTAFVRKLLDGSGLGRQVPQEGETAERPL